MTCATRTSQAKSMHFKDIINIKKGSDDVKNYEMGKPSKPA